MSTLIDRRWGALAAALLFSLTSLCLPVQAGETVIKLATLAPEGSSWLKMVDQVNATLREQTGGEVRIKVYPGGVLGDDRDVIRKMRVGQIHGTSFTTGGLSQIHQEIQVFALPLLIRNDQELNQVQQELAPELEQAFRKKGYELMGTTGLGFSRLFSAREIRTPADLRQTKPWLLSGDPIVEALFQSAGLEGVPLGVADVLTALQTGMVDTVFNVPTGLLGLQWFTRVRTMVDLRISSSIGGIILSRKGWSRIPERHRPVVRQAMAEALAGLGIRVQEDNRRALETIQRQGIRVIPPSPELKAMLERVAGEARRELIGREFRPESLTRVEEILSRSRAGTSP